MGLIDRRKFLNTTRIYKDDPSDVAFRKYAVRQLIKAQPVVDAIPIPEGATNGDMIKAVFPDLEIANDGLTNDNLTGIMAFYGGYNSPLPRGDNWFNRKWWNAPYKGVEK